MKRSLPIGLLILIVPIVADASVTAVWSPRDAAAAVAWLDSINASPSRQDSGTFFYYTTTTTLPISNQISDQITANLTVWDDRAEINILGVGPLPNQLRLWVSFLDLGSILDIQQNQLVVDSSEGASYYSYSSNFTIDTGFSRIVYNSEASDGLLLLADSGSATTDSYTFQMTQIPEPQVAALFVVGGTLLLRRKRKENE